MLPPDPEPEKASPRMLRGIARALLLILVSALFAEGALRLYARVNPVFVFYDGSYDRFRGKPHAEDYDFRLNSRGFKDLEFETPKPPGRYRILGIGDSCVFGVVPYGDHFLTLLEEKLRGVAPDLDVLNLGIPATGPNDYLALLLKEGIPLEPDLVLVHFFIGNDFLDAEWRKPTPSYLLAFLEFLVSLSRTNPGRVIHGAGVYDDERPSIESAEFLEIESARSWVFFRRAAAFPDRLGRVTASLAEMATVSRRHGAELLVVLIPDEVQVDPELQAAVIASRSLSAADMDFAQPNRALVARLDALGIASLDLLPAFQEAARERRLYVPRDTHWNRAGNRLAAELMLAALRSRLAVRATPGAAARP